MIILTIRTDKPQAELGLYDDKKRIGYLKWQADRQLIKMIHEKLTELLNKSSIKLSDVGGITCFAGPGSFTGLRIGVTVANSLAYSSHIPVVASSNDDWIERGIKRLADGDNNKIVVPEYGHEPNITKPKR